MDTQEKRKAPDGKAPPCAVFPWSALRDGPRKPRLAGIGCFAGTLGAAESAPTQRTVTFLCERLRFSPSLILRTPSTKLPIHAAAYRAKRPREMSRSDETRVKDAAFGGPSGARVVVGYGTLTVPRVMPVCAVAVASLPVLRSACRGQSLYGSRWVQQIHRGSEKPGHHRRPRSFGSVSHHRRLVREIAKGIVARCVIPLGYAFIINAECVSQRVFFLKKTECFVKIVRTRTPALIKERNRNETDPCRYLYVWP